MGRIADFPGDSKRKRGDTAEKSGDLPEKLNRVRSLSLFGGGIQRKPRVIRGALLFLHAVALSWFAQPDAIESEILSVGRLITDFSDSEILGVMASVISRRNLADQGHKIAWGGREVDPRYFFRASTLRDWIGHDLLNKHAEQLRALAPAEIIKERKKLRDASRWQDSYTGKGVRTSNEEKLATARLMAAAGASQRAISVELGVSQKTISLWLRSGDT